MDAWTKKKRAAESCGSKGMTKFVDTTEARRLSRLKNMKSSIGSAMMHSGWQKDQIEKRRREQLRKRKEMAKKKPLGEGIRVDTSIQPCDYTKTGLKLTLDYPSSKNTANEEKPVPLSSRLRTCDDASSKVRGTHPNNPTQSKEPCSIRRDDIVHLEFLEDGDAVNVSPQQLKNLQSQVVDGEFKEQLKDLSLSSTADLSRNVQANLSKRTSKRNSFIPRLGSQTCGPKTEFQKVEDKEKCDASSCLAAKYSRPTKLKKSGEHKKHFQLLTDIESLKREHADAIKMLQKMDREENRRRSLDSERASYSFDSDELPEKADENIDYNAKDDSRNINSLCNREIDFSEIISSGDDGGITCDVARTEQKFIDTNLDESFTWLPDGIKDASHLSIVLCDEIESQDGSESTYASEMYRRKAASPSETIQETESDGQYQENCASAFINTSFGVEFSSPSDDYLSD